ncbi:peptidoglycan recognition protein family protein [Chloroflexus aggregans]|uniref:N-acetylmuramoyl-L-alanine amidase family 2 n=1 Tax=Chloroflexus aggregans (strain MD-66 / DSM 9485) TaxID=326427 RepID=B8G9Y1_CHLAD|nr:peptidoglycan recognition family protein [Chloroflexus aggregans]ACL24496.1 N-acetylmuramoyl-L-alanine amidase family 2 [Chloroflexus aggregans DSM 9485]
MIQHKALRIGLLLVFAGILAATLPVAARPSTLAAQVSSWRLSSVRDWEAGSISDLLVMNNAGGELRLAAEASMGTFVSAPFETAFAANAAGAVWRAEVIPGTDVRLELRARATPPGDNDAGWGSWLPLVVADKPPAADPDALTTAVPLALPDDTRYLQLRATFTSQIPRASAILDEVTVSYIATQVSPPIFAAGLPQRPILFGQPVLTERPLQIARADWAEPAAARLERRDPRGVVIHQIPVDVPSSATLAYLRALLVYQTSILDWDDLIYHYIIDSEGNLFEGRLGGPTSPVRLVEGSVADVQIALLTPVDQPPTLAAQARLTALLAWLTQTYNIPPTGQRPLAGGDGLRPTIAGHYEVNPTALDPYPAFRDRLPTLRTQVDTATVRARWYFAEGNTAGYSQRLSFYNPAGRPTTARITLFPEVGQPVVRELQVPGGGRADLNVNELVPGANALPAIVEANEAILAERSMALTSDIDSGPGVDRLSRVWYFADGSTTEQTQTYLIIFNPQPNDASAQITYMRRDGTVFTQDVQIGARNRLVVAVHDITLPDGTRPLANTNFGMRVIANLPVAVERTMRFGPGGSGLHTGRGIDQLGRQWFFAEGTTEGEFRTQLLVLNPNSQPANVEAIFRGPQGVVATRRYAIPPRSQLAIDVNEVVPHLGFATEVKADRPVAVERAMRFAGGNVGTIGAGAREPAYRWAFIDGRTSDATYYLCLSNVSPLSAMVTIETAFGDGTKTELGVRIPAGARYTLALHEAFPNESAVTVIVRSNQPIVAERSLFPGGGVRGGSTALGIPLP